MKFGYNYLQDEQKGYVLEGTRPQPTVCTSATLGKDEWARVDLSVSQFFQLVELYVEGIFCVRYDWGLDELYVVAWQDDEIKVKTTIYRAQDDLGDFSIKGHDELAWAFRRACEVVLGGYGLEVELSNWGRDKVFVDGEPALLDALGELEGVGEAIVTCVMEV